MKRWGNLTADGAYQLIPYGMKIVAERMFDGYTIPTQFAGGWWYGTERYLESVRLMVDWARLEQRYPWPEQRTGQPTDVGKP